MTAQGHPQTIFKRAIERGNLLVAETTLKAEIPRPTLTDLLELTALIAQKDPRRQPRAAARWLKLYLNAADHLLIDDIAFAVAQLRALGGAHHAHALAALQDMAETASGRRSPRGVA